VSKSKVDGYFNFTKIYVGVSEEEKSAINKFLSRNFGQPMFVRKIGDKLFHQDDDFYKFIKKINSECSKIALGLAIDEIEGLGTEKNKIESDIIHQITMKIERMINSIDKETGYG